MGSDIEAVRGATGLAGEEGEIARAAGDIKNALARAQRETGHELGGGCLIKFGDDREIAGFPSGLAAGAQSLVGGSVDVSGAHRSVAFEHEAVNDFFGFAKGLEVF